MNLHLLAGRLYSDLRGILIYGISIILFMLLVLSSYTAVAGSSALITLFNQLPPAFTALVGGNVSRLAKIEGYISLGYVHPIMIAVLAAFSIGVAVRALAGEIDRGTINLLLARPVQRRDLVLSAFAHLVIGLGILALSIILGVWLGLQTLGRAGSQVALSAVLSATLLTLFVFVTVGSYSLVFSAASSDAGRATLLAAGVTLMFYFMNYLATLSADFKPLGTWSIFHYWDPGEALVSNRLDTGALTLFAILSLAFTLLAAIIIERRDIAA